jgi:hypothetical protein
MHTLCGISLYGKTVLIILSTHNINSGIYFVQGLLWLECQKNINAGSVRIKDFQRAAASPCLHPYFNIVHFHNQPGWELLTSNQESWDLLSMEQEADL